MIGSVQKALAILKTVSEHGQNPVTNSFLSEKLSLNKSTCSHIVSTLTAEGFLKKSAGRGYVLGPEAYCLTRSGRYDDHLVKLCRPIMHWLHKKTGCAVILSVIQGGKKFIIDYIDPDALVFAESYEIRPDDLYRTAAGRIMLANMSDEDIYDVFARRGLPTEKDWPGINSFEDLKSKIAEIGKKDVTFAKSDMGNGIIHTGYAVGVFEHSACIAALGIAVSCAADTLSSFTERNDEFSSLLIKARNEIGRRITFT